jgi:site-specific recombinase XerD
MTTNLSMLFYLKKPRNHKRGPVPIYLRLTVNGHRAEVATARAVEPDRWNSESGRATGNKEETRNLNSFLDNLQFRVFEAQRVLIQRGDEITAESLKNTLQGKAQKGHMLIEVFKEHNRKMAALIDKEFAPGTLERYETSLRHTQEFINYQYGITDIEIKKIDNSFIYEYDFYLRSIRKCANNSAVKYLSNFGKIIRVCLSNGWITADPFSNYKGRIKTIHRVFLSFEELQRMADKKFGSERLTQVRDLFLFCCFTGLAYADIKKLRNDQIETGVDGEKWVFTSRQKTDSRSAIPLMPQALQLIEKYRQHPLCVKMNMPLPVPSNQKMNDYLKEIASLCEINKTLTSHIARHTFATTITLSNGVPIESVSKMLGHSSLKQTQHYARVLDNKVSEDMQALRAKIKQGGSSQFVKL